MFENKHRQVVYHEPTVERELTYLEIGEHEETIYLQERERLIVEHSQASSMGQLKIASLAFMKAIQEYVKESVAGNCDLSGIAYPIVLDAPFSDIYGENFNNAVNCINEFSEQVILLIANEDVPDGIVPHVAQIYTVEICADKQYPYSRIKPVETRRN